VPVDPWAIDTLTFSGLEARNADSMFVMANGTATRLPLRRLAQATPA
jgi:hypothetical protein